MNIEQGTGKIERGGKRRSRSLLPCSNFRAPSTIFKKTGPEMQHAFQLHVSIYVN
jgi:hypothetical protein